VGAEQPIKGALRILFNDPILAVCRTRLDGYCYPRSAVVATMKNPPIVSIKAAGANPYYRSWNFTRPLRDDINYTRKRICAVQSRTRTADDLNS